MPYRKTDKGVFFTPRYSAANASIEMIVTLSTVRQFYLLDGRMNGLSTGASNGYLHTLSSGSILSGYGQSSLTITRLDTNEQISQVVANVPLKIALSGIPAGKRISMFGTRYSIAEFFDGKLHSFKTVGWHMGNSNAGTDSATGGLHSDLHLQFDRIIENDSTTPALLVKNKYQGYVPPSIAIEAQAGWTNSDDFSDWTGSTENTLLLGNASILYEAGARIYHRKLRFSADIALNGATGNFSWQRPQNSLESSPLSEGRNQFDVMVRGSTLPRLTFSNAQGVVISNLKLIESHDALIQIATWQKRIL